MTPLNSTHYICYKRVDCTDRDRYIEVGTIVEAIIGPDIICFEYNSKSYGFSIETFFNYFSSVSSSAGRILYGK